MEIDHFERWQCLGRNDHSNHDDGGLKNFFSADSDSVGATSAQTGWYMANRVHLIG